MGDIGPRPHQNACVPPATKRNPSRTRIDKYLQPRAAPARQHTTATPQRPGADKRAPAVIFLLHFLLKRWRRNHGLLWCALPPERGVLSRYNLGFVENARRPGLPAEGSPRRAAQGGQIKIAPWRAMAQVRRREQKGVAAMVLALDDFIIHVLSKLHAPRPQPHPSTLRVGCAALSPHAQRAHKKKPLLLPTSHAMAPISESRRSTAPGRIAPLSFATAGACKSLAIPRRPARGTRSCSAPAPATSSHVVQGRCGTPCSHPQRGGVPSGGGDKEGRTLESAYRACVYQLRLVARAVQRACGGGRGGGLEGSGKSFSLLDWGGATSNQAAERRVWESSSRLETLNPSRRRRVVGCAAGQEFGRILQVSGRVAKRETNSSAPCWVMGALAGGAVTKLPGRVERTN